MPWHLIVTLATLINIFAASATVQAAPRTGYILIDANSGKQLAAKNVDTAFMPASTTVSYTHLTLPTILLV